MTKTLSGTLIRAAIAICVGFGGGLIMADFVTAPIAPAPTSNSPFETAQPPAEANSLANEFPGAAIQGDGPDHYVCKGCGPTLIQRQVDAMSTGAYADYGYRDAASAIGDLPPYEPVPFEDEGRPGR
jgi:hypothetical protein